MTVRSVLQVRSLQQPSTSFVLDSWKSIRLGIGKGERGRPSLLLNIVLSHFIFLMLLLIGVKSNPISSVLQPQTPAWGIVCDGSPMMLIDLADSFPFLKF